MQDKEIYQGVVNTFTEKPKYTITIPISWRPEVEPVPPVKRSLFERLFRGKPVQIEPEPIPTEETFTIYPCKVANMWRVAGAATELPDEIKNGELAEVVLPLINDHLETIVYIVAAGIQNNHEEPSADLIKFIERNFDNQDLHTVLHYVLENVYMQSFLNSIVLAKGTVKILKPKTSPTDGSE
ncbi:hypothetical protein SAMN05421821_105129 [Mucilaginibacter lappiensis]|uniref:Uncharacterized protein n=1 Tax=Mucilaginibacter lappiensis TaxID=354630 RepID=A0ABR6PN60_9SPHI|nr:hypothetical protein [Mucilaginibacter lappiensis]MBB6109711.1 hypothetical protein [Mucilaginibacter lappiensis]SIR12727.1 hypothetical protein SAMN05421821_105129 [Mucilaginibacter lappiensis]